MITFSKKFRISLPIDADQIQMEDYRVAKDEYTDDDPFSRRTRER